MLSRSLNNLSSQPILQSIGAAASTRIQLLGVAVHNAFLSSDWGTFVVAALFFGALITAALIAVLFRLNAYLSAPRRKPVPPVPSLLVETDKDGRMIVTDLDGRPWPGFGASK
jgi:hypothetical protein